MNDTPAARPPSEPPPDPSAPQAPDPRRYGQLVARWQIIQMMAEGAFLAAWVWAGRAIAPWLCEQAAVGRAYWAACVFMGCSGIPYLGVMLPVMYVWLYAIRRRFGLADGTPRWAVYACTRHLLLRMIFPAVLGAAMVLPVTASATVRRALLVIALALLLVPRLLRRRQPKASGLLALSPLPSGERFDRLRRFADERGAQRVGIFLVHTSRMGREAYAAFWPRPQLRVQLGDTLVDLLDDRELLAVFAHELGHYFVGQRWRLKLARLAAWAVVVTGVVAAMPALIPRPLVPWHVVAAVPPIVLMTWLVFLAYRPASLQLQRSAERRAHRWALQATGDPEAYLSAMRKLAERNLTGGRSTWLGKLLFETHPSLEEVVAQARAFQEGQQAGQSDTRSAGGR